MGLFQGGVSSLTGYHPEKLDPKTPSVGESYQAVVQVLDSRGVSRSARRDREFSNMPMMIRTVQAQEQYKALERDLINNLQTEQLQSIQQECVQTAYSLRSEEFKRRFRLGAICIVAALAAKVALSWPMEIAAISCLDHNVHPVLRWLQRVDMGSVFSLPSGESSSLHQWTGMPDDPSRLRFWQEARDGHHGVFEVAAVRLTNADHRAFLLRNSGMRRPVVSMASSADCSGRVLPVHRVSWGAEVAGSPADFSAAFFACLSSCRTSLSERLYVAEQFDPNKRCHGDAYQAIVQTLRSSWCCTAC